MGKASKWFRRLLRQNRSDRQQLSSPCCNFNTSRRGWSFVKSCREKEYHNHQHHYGTSNGESAAMHSTEFADGVGPGKRAIAVAAATTAAAEAAVAAAVVRMTSGRKFYRTAECSSKSHRNREDWAAVKIQAAFRGYLARKALRALKGLVRLQALVRGNIERKRTAERLQRMQTLMRAQERARILRSLQISELSRSNSKAFQFHPIGPATPEKFEHNTLRTRSKIIDQTLKLKRNGSISKSRAELRLNQSESWANELRYVDNVRSGKIFDIEAAKSRFLQKPFPLTPNALVPDQHSHTISSSPACEIQPFMALKDSCEFEEGSLCVVDDSPRYFASSSKGGSTKISPFTPTKSDGSRSCFNGYSDYPNYMADTESSKAKVRSLSAPRQRPGCERLSSANRYSANDYGEARSSAQSASALHASFIAKAYPGSGRLDRLEIPVSYRYY